MEPVKYILGQNEIPTHWYNVVADLEDPPPRPLDPTTHQPVDIEQMRKLTAGALLAQDGSRERWIEIPDDVRRAYALWRPTPLVRARNLEHELQTPARIYYKYEGVSPTGAHKTNSAIPQAYYNALEGVTKLTTETGAGQWGTALAYACGTFGVECEVFWAGASYDQKPYRKVVMRTFGATVHRTPSPETAVGRREWEREPAAPGSIGLAVSEAVEVAMTNDDAGYALGSTAGHVLLHQTVIGQEAMAQFGLAEDYPDVVISCVGGGSSVGGLAFPFLQRNLAGEQRTRIIAVEPSACPVLTRGRYAWDHGDLEGMTPLMKMYTLGHTFVPPPIHAGGLRYHGMSPLVSYAKHRGYLESESRDQSECFRAGELFARTEGVIAAPEATHGIATAIAEAHKCAASGEEKTIMVLVSGHGHYDLSAYAAHQDGELTDAPMPDETLTGFLDSLPEVGQ